MAKSKIGISVGASKEAIVETRKAIMDILNSSEDQSTKVQALEVLSDLCKVSGTSITNCSITLRD